MFDRSRLESVQELTFDDLTTMPDDEDQYFEFKSGQTSDGELSKKLERAASAFANSGGGFFVAGVDNNGRPKGGICDTVGKQPRRDWVDLVIHRVSPVMRYEVKLLKHSSLPEDRAVMVVGFDESLTAPHMASDYRYYLRAGAHTAPASHFVVEAIKARRFVQVPHLAYFLRPGENSLVAELHIVNLSPVPALDVVMTLVPAPPLLMHEGTPGRREFRIIDLKYPATVPFTVAKRGRGVAPDWETVDSEYTIRLDYGAPLGNRRHFEQRFLPRHDLPRPIQDSSPLERIAATLMDLKGDLQRLARGDSRLTRACT